MVTVFSYIKDWLIGGGQNISFLTDPTLDHGEKGECENLLKSV